MLILYENRVLVSLRLHPRSRFSESTVIKKLSCESVEQSLINTSTSVLLLEIKTYSVLASAVDEVAVSACEIFKESA